MNLVDKIISLGLIVVMLILTPLTIAYTAEDSNGKRLVLDEMDLFLDKVCNKKSITKADLDELFMSVNAHGLSLDIRVTRQVTAYTADRPNEITYVTDVIDSSDEVVQLNTSDIIVVEVEELTYSTASRLIYKMLGVDNGKYKERLPKMVG